MVTSWPLAKLLHHLSEENYDRTISAYRFWIGLEATHGGTSNHQLYDDILSSTRPDLIEVPTRHRTDSWGNKMPPLKGQLIHTTAHLLLRFVTDAELDPALASDAIGLHDRLCRESLEQFFRQSLDCIPGWSKPTPEQLRELYTRVNLIAHWVNLGYATLEDVRDHILQSLVLQPTIHLHQLDSLMILLKISGAAFAAYVDSSFMDRCCDLLKPNNLEDVTGLAKVRVLFLRSG